MGACDFDRVGYGKDAATAYRNACADANAEVGHQEGYSGDINSTHGYVEVQMPWANVKETLMNDAVRRAQSEGHRTKKALNEDLKSRKAKVREAFKKLTEATPEERKRMKPRLIIRATRAANEGRFEDKWEPCGCVKIAPKTYYFWGIAPE